jgi:manganese oxidase
MMPAISNPISVQRRARWVVAMLCGIVMLANRAFSQAGQNAGQGPTSVISPAPTAGLFPWSRPDVKPTVTVESGDTGGKLFGRAPDPAKTRHYYIAAESVMWDYAPENLDSICGPASAQSGPAHHPSSKMRYFRYTDATFKTRVKEDAGLGILGPVLRGTVGEYLEVTFLNRTTRPLSMHPHGVRYDKDNEGAYYAPNPGRGGAVGPKATFTYVWQLNESSGPGKGDTSSKAWLYHSHVDSDEESNLGLIGLIIVTDPKRARPDGTPADVDREMATLFMIFDESGSSSPLAEPGESITGAGANLRNWVQTQIRLAAASRYSINGRTFCNLTGLEMNQGERVRWYLCALGSEQDFHTPHWHGLTVVEDARRRTDVIELMPATMKVADMMADNPGTWLLHCHVSEHMREGMSAHFTIYPGGSGKKASTQAFLGMGK